MPRNFGNRCMNPGVEKAEDGCSTPLNKSNNKKPCPGSPRPVRHRTVSLQGRAPVVALPPVGSGAMGGIAEWAPRVVPGAPLGSSSTFPTLSSPTPSNTLKSGGALRLACAAACEPWGSPAPSLDGPPLPLHRALPGPWGPCGSGLTFMGKGVQDLEVQAVTAAGSGPGRCFY